VTTHEVEGVVRAYFEHFEAGDPSAISELFSDDAALMPNGLSTVRGKSAISETFEWITKAARVRCDELIFDRNLELPGAAVVETRTLESITPVATGIADRAEFRELFCLANLDGAWAHRQVTLGNRPNRQARP